MVEIATSLLSAKEENIIQKIELNEEEYNKLISKNMEINRQLPFKIKQIGIICRKFVEKAQ